MNYFKGLSCSYKTNSKFSNDSDQFSQIIVFMMPAGWANETVLLPVSCCDAAFGLHEGKPTKLLPDPAVLSWRYHNEVLGTSN